MDCSRLIAGLGVSLISGKVRAFRSFNPRTLLLSSLPGSTKLTVCIAKQAVSHSVPSQSPLFSLYCADHFRALDREEYLPFNWQRQ